MYNVGITIAFSNVVVLMLAIAAIIILTTLFVCVMLRHKSYDRTAAQMKQMDANVELAQIEADSYCDCDDCDFDDEDDTDTETEKE
jgi:Flp pilus assembly protein TadB